MADKELVTGEVGSKMVDTRMLNKVAELQCRLSYGVMSLDFTLPHQRTEELRNMETAIRRFIKATMDDNPQPV